MYKIILDNKVIDVVRKPRFIKFLSSGNIAITDRASANGIVGSDNKTVYSLYKELKTDVPVVVIKEISEYEFSRLSCLLNSEKDIVEDNTKLRNAINSAVENLSEACKNSIVSGFSVELSDGNTYRFKLTAEDQINLLNLENQLNFGEDTFIYHATDLPCKVFNREDMQKIIKNYRKHVLYHTTYFNSVKQYINSLTDINMIATFSYGTDISSTVANPALKQILLDGGIN